MAIHLIDKATNTTGTYSGTLINADITEDFRPVFTSADSLHGEVISICLDYKVTGLRLVAEDGSPWFRPATGMINGVHTFTTKAKSACGTGIAIANTSGISSLTLTSLRRHGHWRRLYKTSG